MKRWTGMLGLLAWLCAASPAVSGNARTPAAPADDVGTAQAVAQAEARGRQMFEHDLAAERATDALLEQGMRGDTRVRGWITEQRGSHYEVSMIGDGAVVLYRAATDAQGRMTGATETLDVPAAPTTYQAGAAAARALALNSAFDACAQTYNSVVLPAPGTAADAWTVYLLPATTDPAVVPLGGTHRLDIAHGRIVSRRAFTHSCIQLKRAPPGAAMFITHLQDPTPTEIHVFWSLWARSPLYVSTGKDVIWKIEDGRIRRMQD